MRKINYGINKKDIDRIKENYYSIFNDNDLENKINNYLKCFNKEYKENIDFKYLLTSSFEQLVDIHKKLLFWSKNTFFSESKYRNEFTNLFLYDGDNQKKISSFFMTNFDFKICHYCDEQYISSFVDFQNDYEDYLDFLNNASFEELCLLPGVGEVKANYIIESRKQSEIKSNTKFNFNFSIIDLNDKYDILVRKKTHNYFTLDHALPQGKFPFFSLSFFNLVPSCYSCNSKFKNRKEFPIDNIKEVSPTSSSYDIDQNIKFTILTEFDKLDKNNFSLKDIRENFKLKISTNSQNYVSEYLKIFKLNGRYLLYKDEIIKILNKRIKYPDSELVKISQLTGITIEELKKDIFGEDLFDSTTNVPLSKMKNDIAEYLKLK